jgi:STE24 endopeptidase
MRASLTWIAIAGVLLAGLGWGWSVGRDPVPVRPADETMPVDASWYAGLPLEPAAATEAYLARVPTEMRARGEAYSEGRLLAFGLELMTVLLSAAALCTSGLAAHMRDLAARVTSRPALTDLLVGVQYFAALFAVSLPSQVYAGFARPHRAGFSDQPFLSWLSDQLLGWSVFTLLYLVAVVAIYWAIRRHPRSWIGWAIGVFVLLRTLYSLASPGLIEPLTNDFRPLPDGPQRREILALARANGIAEAAVVTGNASRQSRVLNAHVSGFGRTTRISVDDTTLAAASPAMLSAVVAHEIGHFVLLHETLWVVSDSLIMALGLLAIGLGTRLLVERFGARWRVRGTGDIASLPVFWGLFLLWGLVSLPASNVVSRALERQADLFGLNASQAPHGLAEFMIHDADTARLRPTALEYALFYTHPSDAERVAAAMRWRAEMAGRTAPASGR